MASTQAQQAYKDLVERFRVINHCQHLAAIAGWDEAVMMPSGGGKSRSDALGTLHGIMHEKLIDPKIGECLALVKAEVDEFADDQWVQSNIKLMQRHYQRATALPNELVCKMSAVGLQCEQAWRSYRAANDWQSFAPLLAENLSLVREAAELRVAKSKQAISAYDILLDDYSPGMNQSQIDPIFAKLAETIPQLIPEITARQAAKPLEPLTGPFATSSQKQLGLRMMQAIGFDFNHGRLDISHHPFCGGVPRDVRITTRYNEDEFLSAIMGVCHETGHAMYELGLPEEYLDQPVGEAYGMALHESQSLLIEMQACRSKAFLKFMSAQASEIFGEHAGLNPANLHGHYLKVEPGLIRVNADEVTYPLHVILRYEIEKQLIAGEVQVNDLPELWDHYMQQYLGLSTKDDYKDGVMQDVHWPSGAFGYFPAYTLGALIAAQLFQAAKTNIGEEKLFAEFEQGNFVSLITWLRANVHSNASSFSMQELLEQATGNTLSADAYLQHIRRRYC